jgi:acetyltransferase-like isoleucine patch superfamily enzyme
LSGNTTIGTETELGTGSVVLPGVSIGSNTVVGAGAAVNSDLPPGCTAVGVPARPLSE